jgi:hypothetical protein
MSGIIGLVEYTIMRMQKIARIKVEEMGVEVERSRLR